MGEVRLGFSSAFSLLLEVEVKSWVQKLLNIFQFQRQEQPSLCGKPHTRSILAGEQTNVHGGNRKFWLYAISSMLLLIRRSFKAAKTCEAHANG